MKIHGITHAVIVLRTRVLIPAILCCLSALLAPEFCAQAQTADLQSAAQKNQTDLDFEKLEHSLKDIIIKTAADDDWNNYQLELRKLYQLYVSPARVKILSGADSTLIAAEQFMGAYLLDADDQEALNLYGQIVLELERRKIDDNEVNLRQLNRIYIANRDFKQARQLRAQFPDIAFPALPTFLDKRRTETKSDRTILSSVDKFVWEKQSIDFSNWTGVLIIAHPLCHFSQNAIKYIGQDEVLTRQFIKQSLWLAGPFNDLSDDSILNWNNDMTQVQFQMAWLQADWPEINYWGSPTFYFFKDGQLRFKKVGWPGDEESKSREELLHGFKAIAKDK